MTESEFLKKYWNENVFFTGLYKYTCCFENLELGIWCAGVLDYRDEISAKETVGEIYNLENFQFKLIDNTKQ